MSQPQEPFFVGYLPKMPAAHAAAARVFAIVVGVVALVALVVIAAAQNRVDEGTYEFGVLKPFAGVIYTEPVPMLRVVDDKTAAVTNYLLVGATKVGIPDEVRAPSGKKVSFTGSLVQRGSQVMVEMNSPETFAVLGEPSPAEARPATESLGPFTFRGEVVDTKCFFGAMRPAIGKIHRGCAIRCLSGGVPPGLRVTDAQGHEALFLLAGQPGKALDIDVQLAGVTVEVTGTVELDGNIAVLRVERLGRVE